MAATTFPRFLEPPEKAQRLVWQYDIGSRGRDVMLDYWDSYEVVYHDFQAAWRRPLFTGPVSGRRFSTEGSKRFFFLMHTCHLSRQIFLEHWKRVIDDTPLRENHYWAPKSGPKVRGTINQVLRELLESSWGVDESKANANGVAIKKKAWKSFKGRVKRIKAANIQALNTAIKNSEANAADSGGPVSNPSTHGEDIEKDGTAVAEEDIEHSISLKEMMLGTVENEKSPREEEEEASENKENAPPTKKVKMSVPIDT